MLRVGTGTSAEGFGIDSRFGEDRYEWRLVLSAGSRVGVRRAEPFMRGRGNATPHLLTAAPESDLRGRCLFSPDSPRVCASASIARAVMAIAQRAPRA